ncbi:unnamed protein product [Calypogeia fissa]
MGSLSTRRVIRRSAPAKITVVEGEGCGGDASEKENIVNCSLYSLFEAHYVKSSKSPAHPQELAGGMTEKVKSVLQPRKRLLNDRTIPPVSEHSRELTPPELTTSDTFKPAKRTLAPNKKPADNKPGDEGFKQLPNVKIPEPITSESCDVLVSSPTELTNVTTPELKQGKAAATGRRDLTKKTPTHGRRLSIVRLSIARDGTALPSSKKDGNSTIKTNATTTESGVGNPVESVGKAVVFSAQKRIPLAEQSHRGQRDTERARSRVLERRKSVGPKIAPVMKQGIGSCGGRSDVFKKNVAEKVSPPGVTNSARKVTPDTTRTRRLALALKSEQRLTEKNEQNGIQLRQLQAEIEERDHEVEKLRSAALLLNNLINRQGEEIRELRFRLKETFNENAEVRHVCETLERDLRKTREALSLERIQKASTKPYEPNVVSLTSHLQSMTISMEPPMIRSCIEEGQENAESQEESQGRDESACAQESEAEGIVAESCPSVQELPQTQTDQDAQFTLQDLREMVMHEEDLLKERCADALRELNLPMSPLLTPAGSLDVGSLKAMLASISCKEEYSTTERITSIRKLSTWLGQS